jgi:uncharacterized protein
MLKRTFVHLPGIGLIKEKKLWGWNIVDWNSLKANSDRLFNGKSLSDINKGLKASYEAFEKGDLHYFYENLPRAELWRLIPENEKSIAFLDIETTGLELPPLNQTTTISVVMNGRLFQAYSPGEKRKLISMLEEEAKIFVTYFGEVFDLPFLRNEFKTPLKKAHIDLCFMLKRQGYQGGLKVVETRVPGIPKRKSNEIDGYAAVRLWNMYKKGVAGALETLLVYNGEDTVVLQHLLLKAMEFEIEKRPELCLKQISLPIAPKIPGEINQAVVRKLQNHFFNPIQIRTSN